VEEITCNVSVSVGTDPVQSAFRIAEGHSNYEHRTTNVSIGVGQQVAAEGWLCPFLPYGVLYMSGTEGVQVVPDGLIMAIGSGSCVNPVGIYERDDMPTGVSNSYIAQSAPGSCELASGESTSVAQVDIAYDNGNKLVSTHARNAVDSLPQRTEQRLIRLGMALA